MAGTILLADDSLTIQKVVELTFADTGFSVVAVSTGDELLRRLTEVRPDVIICDVIMPGRDGYDVCQQVKSNPSTLHIPVILLTGTFEPFDRDRALAAGSSEIISKPFEARRLVETVERMVREARAVPPPEPELPVEGAVRPPAFERAATPPPPPTPQPTPTVFVPSPSPFQAAPPPPPVAAAPADFETQMVRPEPEPFPEPGEEVPPFTEPAAAVAPVTPPEEELDFTGSGFAEMEAAGRQTQSLREEIPAEGLEFEREELPAEVPGTPIEPARAEVAPEPAPTAAAAPGESWTRPPFRGESPWADRSWDKPEVEPVESWLERPGGTAPAAPAEEPFLEPEERVPLTEPWQEAAVQPTAAAGEPGPFGGEEPPTAEVEAPPEPEPLLSPEQVVEPFAAPPAPAEPAAYTTAPISHEPALAGLPEEEAFPAPEEPFAAPEDELPAPWQEAVPEALAAEPTPASAPPPVWEEPAPMPPEPIPQPTREPAAPPAWEQPAPLPPEPTPEPTAPPAFEQEAEALAEPTPTEVAAPSEPVAAVAAPAATVVPEPTEELAHAADTQPSVATKPAAAAGPLSDEEIDRIARRVLELAAGTIEQIAWEVIPDMAEIVIRERVRAIEAELERESPEPVQ